MLQRQPFSESCTAVSVKSVMENLPLTEAVQLVLSEAASVWKWPFC